MPSCLRVASSVDGERPAAEIKRVVPTLLRMRAAHADEIEAWAAWSNYGLDDRTGKGKRVHETRCISIYNVVRVRARTSFISYTEGVYIYPFHEPRAEFPEQNSSLVPRFPLFPPRNWSCHEGINTAHHQHILNICKRTLGRRRESTQSAKIATLVESWLTLFASSR
jgi:hypothetical protein